MSQHTPGPWTVEDRRGAPLKNIRVVAGSREVAQVHDVHQRDYLGHFSGTKEAHAAADAIDAVGLANARLIAAAPELLAALIAIRNYARDSRTGRMLTGEGYAMADAAIAKAESQP